MSDPVLIRASFLPAWKKYYLINTAIVLTATVVGIPLMIVLLPLALWIIRLQYEAMTCDVTEKFLKYRRGILTRVEKNVPLEQITDLGVVEGPIMRWLGIKQLTVETAGQSSMQGPLVTLLAVDDAETFRDQVLAQRDRLRSNPRSDSDEKKALEGEALQREILETLKRIEQHLSTSRGQSQVPE